MAPPADRVGVAGHQRLTSIRRQQDDELERALRCLGRVPEGPEVDKAAIDPRLNKRRRQGQAPIDAGRGPDIRHLGARQQLRQARRAGTHRCQRPSVEAPRHALKVEVGTGRIDKQRVL